MSSRVKHAFPSIEVISAGLNGRDAYTKVRMGLFKIATTIDPTHGPTYFTNYQLKNAIAEAARADLRNEFQPPLSGHLSQMLQDATKYIENEDPQPFLEIPMDGVGYEYNSKAIDAAVFLLHAIIDHGSIATE